MEKKNERERGRATLLFILNKATMVNRVIKRIKITVYSETFM